MVLTNGINASACPTSVIRASVVPQQSRGLQSPPQKLPLESHLNVKNIKDLKIFIQTHWWTVACEAISIITNF